MKSSRKLNKQRERFHQEIQEARAERKFEAGLFKEHPHDQATGERLAKEFVDRTRAFVDWVEKYRHMKPTDPAYQAGPKGDRPNEHEVEQFLTPEQHAELETIYARFARMDEIDKAVAYDELLETLERAGLGIDTLVSEDGSGEDIITVEILSIAKEWWDEASKNAYEDGEG